MKKEAQELGFDPWGDTAQEEFERQVTELEQHALKIPEDDLEILFYEQEGFRKSKCLCFLLGSKPPVFDFNFIFLDDHFPHLLESAVEATSP